MSPDTKAGLAGWVLIIVGIAGVYALFKYPKQVLTASLIGFCQSNGISFGFGRNPRMEAYEESRRRICYSIF